MQCSPRMEITYGNYDNKKFARSLHAIIFVIRSNRDSVSLIYVVFTDIHNV